MLFGDAETVQIYEAAEARPREFSFALFPTYFPVQPVAVEMCVGLKYTPVLAVIEQDLQMSPG